MAGGDDTTQDPLMFNNVPRRPRSAAAASWPPRKEEPDGGDPGGGFSSVSNNASPPSMTSVASNSNKRPASSTAAGGGGAEHVPRAKKHRLLVPIEKPEPKDAKDRGVVILGGMPPALLSHKDKAAAAAAAASSIEAEPAAVDWAKNERYRKGKTPVVNEDDGAFAAVARWRPAGSGLGNNGKLAIRSHKSTAVAAGSFKPASRTMNPEKPRTKPKQPRKDRNRPKPKKKEKPAKDRSAWFWCGMGRDGTSAAGSDADYSFDRIAVVSDRLQATLRSLGVAAAGPVRLYGRLLTRCDRDKQHARLLMSIKKWRAEDAEFPICAFLTEQEKEEAYGEGLPLTAYDRGGHAYELKFRFLESNGACRLISKWTDFLKHNGLVVRADEEQAPENDDVMVDLWLFRTPGGEVGMVVLHYRRGDAPHADAALDQVEQKRLQRMLNNAAAAAGGNAVMEDVVDDENEEEDEDAGVKGEVAAAPSSPSEPSGGGGGAPREAAGAGASSPSSESDAGVGAKAAEEQAAGALGEAADAPSTSPELHGGAGRSDEVTAQMSLGGGDGTEAKQAEAGGSLMVMMVMDVEAVTKSSLDSNAGDAANEVAAPPSSSPEAGDGAGTMSTEDEDDSADELVEAAARSWNVTKDVIRAAQALMMMSEDNRMLSDEDNSNS